METIRLSLFVMLCLGIHRSSSDILHRQKRTWIIDSFRVDEDYEGPFPYSLGKIKVEKKLVLFEIHGQGVDKEPTGILKINNSTGEIFVHGPVDYEKFKVLKLTFKAIDTHKHVIDTQLGIEIQIIDSNDNPPKFDLERYTVNLKESTPQGTEVITIMASDFDTGKNGVFDFKIVSVTPKPHELEFFLNQRNSTGRISFKGCLDHEKADTYTIVVEAKDRGEKKQLSSSCTIIINIEDGNNHRPKITGQTGPGRVKEGEENVLVSRLQVTDEDIKGTGASRAKYQIQGDTNNNFIITTDPETNEGLLYVKKPLDYEDSPQKNLNISVENEIPYHSCKVVNRHTTGLWQVVTDSGGRSTYQVTVAVEDVNDPAIFDNPNQQVTVVENVEAGQYLAVFTARDPDFAAAKTFLFQKGEDPENWVTVDSVTGKITTTKIIDRESPHVKDNTYKVTVYAVDNGKPPMTSTATLSIHVRDENDNKPYLVVSTFDMCQSDGPSLANITAFDLDEEPYGGPFRFMLLGERGKWRIDPEEGFSVNLVKENTVHSGHFELLLKVSDLQGVTAVHNLSITVCNCLDTARPNCHFRKATGTALGEGTLGIIFFSILLLAGMLLLAFLVSCKTQSIAIPGEDSGQHLMSCNIENPGTDCKVNILITKVPLLALTRSTSNAGSATLRAARNGYTGVAHPDERESFTNTTATTAAVPQAHSEHAISKTEQQQRNYLYQLITDPVSEASQACSDSTPFRRKSFKEQEFTRGNSLRWSFASTITSAVPQVHSEHTISKTEQHQRKNLHQSKGASSAMRKTHQHRHSMRGGWVGYGTYSPDQEFGVVQHGILFKVLNTMLSNLQAPGKELGDYDPHVYAEEGDMQTKYELDAISIPDVTFDLDLDLNFKFNTLASVSMPGESTAYSTV
ncbi:cadherin-like protein 26 [Micropterus dolomieu]|uniref:cadherin-like protein 26 n=1 Tax=Micropterus dolomieu TaxID=147949 RepID=UPI001E8DE40C|nr:cadherin-like protein 26 [Micropterus dolomieu]